MYQVSAIGELLIDFTQYGISVKNNKVFECNPGGAPANVLAACSKLGLKTAFIGKVGNDEFGSFLKRTIDDLEIDSKGLILSNEFKTTLAFVHLNDEGDRAFSFYRNPGADMMLRHEEINYEIIKFSEIFHFGSVSMTSEPSRFATLQAVKFAKENCKYISYDPNLREPLWDELKNAKESILSMMNYCDILKISEEELEFITGTTDLEIGSFNLIKEFDISIIFVTRGKKGSFVRTKHFLDYQQAYNVKTIDTTGAGDAFVGAAIYQIYLKDKHINDFLNDETKYILDFASAASSLATTNYGAIMSMPDINQIHECMKNIEKIWI